MEMLSTVFEFSKVNIPTWIALAMIVVFAVVLFVTQRNAKWNVRMLCMGSMCIVLGFVLSYVRIIHLPQGGSITPGSMLPLLLFAFLFGWKPGLLCAAAYGILQMFQDPYLLNPMQILLDYPMAFGCLAMGGLFAKRSEPWAFPVGICIAIFGRFACHVVSGAVYFAEYAGDMNPWIYSIGYNGSILLIEAAICVLLAVILQRSGAISMLRREFVRSGSTKRKHTTTSKAS